MPSRNLHPRPSALLRTAAIVALAVAAAAAAAQTPRGRPLAIEDSYRAQAIGAVAPSADAQWVTFTVTTPIASPDGKWLATVRDVPPPKVEKVYASDFERRHEERFEGVQFDWVEFHRDASAPTDDRTLTALGVRPIGVQWSPDGTFVYFTAGIGGATHLFRVSPEGGAVRQLTTGQRRLGDFAFDKAMTKVAFTVGLKESSSDISIANIDGTGERQLTHVHDAFTSEVALSRADRLQFRSPDGTMVEGWLTYPYGYTKDGQDVMAAVDHAIARFPIDRRRVATIGHSYGGFMTNWLITQYPSRFAAAVSGAGIVNWTSDFGNADIPRTKETEFYGSPWEERARAIMIRQSPLTYAGRVRTPTLFINGAIDQRVPFSENVQLFVALKKNGVPSKMIEYADMPHAITGSWNVVHRMLNERRWLDTYLRTAP